MEATAQHRSGWPFEPATEPYVSLATFRRSGKEVRTPVWIAEAGGRYYLFTEGSAGKVKRVRANGRARLAACDLRGRIRSDSLEATARVVPGEETAVIESAYAALREKYGWQMKTSDFFAKVSGRYAKRAILELQVAREQM